MKEIKYADNKCLEKCYFEGRCSNSRSEDIILDKNGNYIPVVSVLWKAIRKSDNKEVTLCNAYREIEDD